MMETAVPANQTAQSLAATSTRAIELQATAAAEALQIGSTTPPAQPQTTPASTGPVTYIVKQGDTLFRIAARYGTTVNEIMRLNGLSSEGLAVGQSLTLPNPPLTPEAGGEIVVTAVSPDTPIATPSGEQFVELVIRQTATSLHSGPGPDFSEIMPLQRGTFAFAVGRNPSGDWYLIQLEDGFTRGWLPTVAVGLLSPAVPEMIPIITTQ
ncbi:MAG: LysM peptidoglycan-binding domain-containing protein [Chloroflexi bacterium]|nr:LysM peptidoglycan-binding domain-containing protein [Chloroflexota bacterium]